MNKFSKRPLVASSLIGLRAFRFDTEDQLLRGPMYNHRFRAGENIAKCYAVCTLFQVTHIDGTVEEHLLTPRDDFRMVSASIAVSRDNCQTWSTIADLTRGDTVEGARVMRGDHAVGELACTCGFYAYLNGENKYVYYGNVSGIIEGYGVCTVGDSGFRASKARLLCLIADDQLASMLQVNYSEVPVFSSYQEATLEFPLTSPNDYARE